VGLRNDCQVHGHTGLDIEREASLGLVHVISDTVLTSGLAEFLVAERPQVVATVSSKVVVLYIRRGEWVVGGSSTRGTGLTSCSPVNSLLG